MIKNEDLRTPWRVRLVVGLVAVALLLSTLAVYLTVFVQYGAQPFNVDTATTSELEEKYNELSPIVSGYATAWSDEYFETFKAYRADVKAYNEEAIEYGARDLKPGTGRMIEKASDPYLAYYVGWKSDEEVIDSSFDNYENPTSLKTPLVGTTQMIQGWLEGIIGMQIGGIREISIPSDYAYGSGALKFIVMLIPYEEDQLATINELNDVQNALYEQYAAQQQSAAE